MPKQFISELTEVERYEWYETMTHYAFELKDWEDARTLLISYLFKDRKTAEESEIRSYLTCCAESVSGSTPLPDLSSTLTEFYIKFGMEETTNL